MNHINASGNDIPDPIESFDQLTKTNVVNKKILENLLKYQFEKPSPVQMQVIPILLNVRKKERKKKLNIIVMNKNNYIFILRKESQRDGKRSDG